MNVHVLAALVLGGCLLYSVTAQAYAIADSLTAFAPHLNQQQMESILKE